MSARRLAASASLLLALAWAPLAHATSLGGDFPVDGPDDAKVTVVMFGGFSCPYCGKAALVLRQLRDRYVDDVRVVWLHHPLSFHPQAMPSARAAIAAQLQGKFWPMWRRMMAQQKQLGRLAYTRWAKELGLDVDRFVRDMGSAAVTERVRQELAISTSLGTRGTPYFLVNGVPLSGARPLAEFLRLVDDELASWDEGVAAGLDRHDLHAHRVRVNNPKIAAHYTAWLIRGDPAPKQPLKAAKPKLPKVPMSNHRVPLDRDDGVLGAADPLVTMVAFVSYQCPYCGRAEETVQTLLKGHGKQWLQVRIKHNPLPFHKLSPGASIAAICAGRQGKFAAMHGSIFADQRNLTQADLASRARRLGLDLGKFRRCQLDPSAAAVVKGHVRQARAVKATGTPSFFLNGRKMVGAQPIELFEQVLQEQKRQAEAVLAGGKVTRKGLYAHLQRAATGGAVPSSASGTKIALPHTPSLWLGRSKGPVDIHVFTELSCPYCVQLLPPLLQLVKKRPKTRVALLHYPLSSACNPALKVDMHPASCQAAVWMEAAAKQRKLPAFLDAVAAHGPIHRKAASSPRGAAKAEKKLMATLEGLAGKARMNLRRARRFGEKADIGQLLDDDLEQARKAGVRGTPTICVHRLRYAGDRTAEALMEALDANAPAKPSKKRRKKMTRP